jgi:hypothetical protein
VRETVAQTSETIRGSIRPAKARVVLLVVFSFLLASLPISLAKNRFAAVRTYLERSAKPCRYFLLRRIAAMTLGLRRP